MPSVSETEKAYIAGLLDGEGCISVIRADQTKRSRHKSPSYRLVVSIYNTNKVMMDWLEQRVNGCRYHNRQKSERHKICHIINIESQSAERFLIEMQPYIIAKSKQLQLGLELLRLVDTWRRERGHVFPPIILPQEEIEKREAIYQRMRELNNGWKWNKERNYQSSLRRQF